ncbi:hypothetical protein [Streptomyces sp. NPDC060035]|uniref:hypothetical protein n=1 Tax=Streptomyces sp. NPDC060035 TaxID=3347044 RepID=UPI0036CF653A
MRTIKIGRTRYGALAAALTSRTFSPAGTGGSTLTAAVPGLTGAPAATYEVVRKGGEVRVATNTDQPYTVTVVG